MLQALLQKIGFQKKDALVYLACLELGTKSRTSTDLAKATNLKRSIVHSILNRLSKKGFVKTQIQNDKRYFTPAPIEYLLEYLEMQKYQLNRQRIELEKFLPQFEALGNDYTVSPKIQVYPGLKGIKQVMDITFNSSEPLRTYSSMDAWFLHENAKDYILWYGQQRVYKHELSIRSANIDSPASRKYLEHDYPEVKINPLLSHFRWFPKNTASYMSEMNIFEDKIAIACLYPHELLGIMIKSEPLAKIQKAIFDSTWNTYGKAVWEMA